MERSVDPLIARSAPMLPMVLANLKPWPAIGPRRMSRLIPEGRPMTKWPSAVLAYMQTWLRTGIGSSPGREERTKAATGSKSWVWVSRSRMSGSAMGPS